MERTFDPASFPFPVTTVDASRALAERQRLSADGVAVVLGGDDRASQALEMLALDDRSVADILELAASLEFPRDLMAEQARQEAEAKAFLAAHPVRLKPINIIIEGGLPPREATQEELDTAEERAERGPDLGVWPAAPESMAFSANRTWRGAEARVHIAVLPTRDETEAPAYLKFGGWNACPAPEYHVAALRHWRQTNAVSLVTCGADLLELAIGRKPSRNAALALAKDQYAYCNDLIDQGFGTFSALAASLTVSDWWSFWWD